MYAEPPDSQLLYLFVINFVSPSTALSEEQEKNHLTSHGPGLTCVPGVPVGHMIPVTVR